MIGHYCTMDQFTGLCDPVAKSAGITCHSQLETFFKMSYKQSHSHCCSQLQCRTLHIVLQESNPGQLVVLN